MNRFFIFAFFTLCITACNENENDNRASPVAAKYSPAINGAIDSGLLNYYFLSETLVQWDSTKVDSAATILGESLNQLSQNLDTVTGDTRRTLLEGNVFFNQAANAVQKMLADGDLTAKRHSFHLVSENLFAFLDAIEYDHKPVYLQECTMPFNDTGRGVWISKTEEKRNPYLGLHHPYYKAGMLECGTLEKKIGVNSKDN